MTSYQDTRYKRNNDYNYNFITMDQVRTDKPEWIPYFGPCRPVSENWMIRNAVEDIKRNGRDEYGLIRTGSQAMIYIRPNRFPTSKIGPYVKLRDGDNDTSTPDGQPVQETEESEIELPEAWTTKTSIKEQGEMESTLPSGKGEKVTGSDVRTGIQLVPEVPETEGLPNGTSSGGPEGEEHSNLLPALPALPYRGPQQP